jgi:hypothetical protein
VEIKEILIWCVSLKSVFCLPLFENCAAEFEYRAISASTTRYAPVICRLEAAVWLSFLLDRFDVREVSCLKAFSRLAEQLVNVDVTEGTKPSPFFSRQRNTNKLFVSTESSFHRASMFAKQQVTETLGENVIIIA